MKKNFLRISILALFLTCADSAISDEEISSCVCEDEDRVVIVENVGEEQYAKIHKLQNDLLCELFITNRVDSLFRKDILICSRDADTWY